MVKLAIAGKKMFSKLESKEVFLEYYLYRRGQCQRPVSHYPGAISFFSIAPPLHPGPAPCTAAGPRTSRIWRVRITACSVAFGLECLTRCPV